MGNVRAWFEIVSAASGPALRGRMVCECQRCGAVEFGEDSVLEGAHPEEVVADVQEQFEDGHGCPVLTPSGR